MLERLQEMVDELMSTNSNNDKIEILKKYDDLKTIIQWTYNPFKKFNVTSKSIEKHPEANDAYIEEDHIYTMLDDLSKRNISGHAALAAVNGYIENHMEYKDIILSVIDKNLKIRMSDTTINKVFPGLIPEFKCQLADKFDINRVPDFTKETWFASRKLDGVRCLTVVKGKGADVKCYSRTGNEFQTLDVVREAIKTEMAHINYNIDYVLDGEMCIVDENGDEDFASMMKVINKKDFEIPNPRYKIFDVIPLEDFLDKTGVANFSIRDKSLSYIESPSGVLSHVKQTKIDDIESFNELSAEATELGWEGLIIRKDVPYAGKRTKNMLKVKEFHDAEYVVESVVPGMVRYINKETGLESEEEMLSSIVITHKENTVNVGSGFTLEQRQQFHKNPELIVGKTITVKYFEESKDMKKGTLSLRFPVLKHIHGDKREV